ncbi:hypothetical protein BKA65DRAFT_551150 [Rhexocercosporidium sp. MPI-PUGE-AT-0058]|nr:hypothetical protein BKA65DRAFT_551150 [Rhexocercosporidium sp. MPI-PUGE-AT-0058]
MAANTYSTTAIDGSADQFAPSATASPPRTPAQVAADAALASQRVAPFIADPSLPVVTPRSYIASNYNAIQANRVPSRTQAAEVKIAAFDASFNNNGNNANNANNN